MKQLLVVLLLLLSFGSASQEGFKGKVVDESNENPIPFARIFFPDLQTGVMADSTGNFEFSQPLKGTFKVKVSASGYESRLINLDLTSVSDVIVRLNPSHILLDKVIVSSTDGILQRESITNIESVKLSDINQIPSATLGEAMTNIPGVYQSNLGPGISKPVVRGLSGPRVVSYLNGIRIENQQWGADHGMGVTDVGIGSVEIIKGPASLLYGSDAMGGVIFFKDESFADANSMEGYVSSRFDAVSLGTTNRAGLKINRNGFKVNSFLGVSNHSDYRVPDGQYVWDSRYSENVGRLSIGYNKRNWVMNLRYSFLNQRIGLPGHTHDLVPDVSSFLRDKGSREANNPAQSIFNHYVSLDNKFFFKRSALSVILGNTTNSLREFDEQFTIPAISMRLNNSVYQLKWVAHLSDNIDVFLGSQGMYRVNTNGADGQERIIPDGTVLDAGVYALLSGKKGKWRYQAGGRFDYRMISTDGDAEYDPLDRRFTALNYSAGLARISKHSSVRLNISSGFRAPTSSELLSDGVHHGSNRYEIGDANLLTENAIQVDAALGLHFEHFEFLLNPFVNYVRNYIYLQRQDSIIDALSVYRYEQAASALITGADVGVHYHPHFAHWLHLESSYSMVYTEDDQGNPLTFIPQTRINSTLKFEFEMGSKFKFTNVAVQHVYRFGQYRPGELETETAPSHMVNIGLNMELGTKAPMEFSVGVQNLLNQAYFDHLSQLKLLGITSPGINIYGSVKLSFKKTKK